MNNDLIQNILKEFLEEKRISSFEKTTGFEKKIKTAMQDISENLIGSKIDFKEDLVARDLVKEYVFYDFYNRLPEFKERYANEFTKLQFKYNSSLL